MFVTFEGPEGCGKSTQSKQLQEYLLSQGRDVVLTLEPGGTELGQYIRTVLLKPGSQLANTTEIFLFAADRAEHVTSVIKPALAAGKIVISDRYIDSTLAYQLGGRSLPEDQVRYLNMISSGGLLPDLTIMLDVSPEIGLARATRAHGADRFEQEQINFHQRVRAKYLEIADNEKVRIKVINTDKLGIEEIQTKIRHLVNEVLNGK